MRKWNKRPVVVWSVFVLITYCGAGLASESNTASAGCKGAIQFPDKGLEQAVRVAIKKPKGAIRYEERAPLSL